MTDHLKVLDCDQKAVLGIPPAAFKLLMCCFMNEDVDDESYMSQKEVKGQTGMGVTTIVKWSRWLKENGWLVDTGKTAYDKLLARGKVPSANSKQVPVYRAVLTPLQNLEGDTTSESEDKVSGSSSYSLSCTKAVTTTVSSSRDSRPTSVESKAVKNQDPKNPKPENQTPHGPRRMRRTAEDGTPYPPDFDSWTNSKRIAWNEAHRDAEHACGKADVYKKKAGRLRVPSVGDMGEDEDVYFEELEKQLRTQRWEDL
jgi:hypothetical protein